MEFLQQLYIDFATKEKYTAKELEEIIDSNIPASDFYLDMNSHVKNDGYIKNPIIATNETSLDGENLWSGLKNRISSFYEKISIENRKVIFDNYKSHLELLEIEIPKNFVAENTDIPDYLLVYLWRNSELFFIELDVSDNYIWVESLLSVSIDYVKKLQQPPNEMIAHSLCSM